MKQHGLYQINFFGEYLHHSAVGPHKTTNDQFQFQYFFFAVVNFNIFDYIRFQAKIEKKS